MTDEVIEQVARLGASLHLRAGDAFYVATAVEHGARVVTWDQEQRTRGAAIIATATPADDLTAEASDP